MKYFYCYIARCNDNSLYTGTCVNLNEREKTHNNGKGAKYTRQRLPIKFVYNETFKTLSAARKRECQVKKLTRQEKENLIK